MPPANSRINSLFRHGDLWLVAGLFGTVLLLILPITPFLLDLLLTLSIALALLTLLVILYQKEPSDFTGFPVLLLFLTLFRLALNVASTRLILLDGYAGHIIEAFGNFVVRGNYIVGGVVFLILVLINFIVITKGAGRIAEVAARFTLDALPGKQMAIDADLNAGIIREDEARARRKLVEQEADFYGAMDGASKFVRGDAIAAILITLINVVGGFAVGVFQKDMNVTDAIQRFTLLSIGDGLVSQVPALVTSTAAGILITRASSKNNLGQDLTRQLLFYPKAMGALSGMLAVLALVPGLPFVPFMTMAATTFVLTRTVNKYGPTLAAAEAGPAPAAPSKPAAAAAEPLESLLGVDTFQIELGYGLVGLADARKGGDLLERITGVRRTIAQELGIVVPSIRVRDNLQAGSHEYRFVLKGETISQGELMPGRWLAMNATHSATKLNGIAATEPVFQLPATWINDVERRNAELAGYTVVDASSVLVTHLSETLKRNAYALLSRQDVQVLLDNLKKTHATVINELIPGQLTVGAVQRILQNLLAEGLPIRNLAGILEKVSDHTAITKNPDDLSEYARRALGLQIVKQYQADNGGLRAITLDPRLEQQIAQGLRQTATEVTLVMEPKLAQHLMDRLTRLSRQMLAAGQAPVVLCAPQIRLAFRRFFEHTFADLGVLSYAEIPPRVAVQSVATVPCPE